MMMAYDTGPDPVLSNHDLRPVVLHASMKDSETKMFWPTGEAVNHGLGTLKTKLRLEFIISVVKLRQLNCMKCTRHAQVVYNIWIQIQGTIWIFLPLHGPKPGRFFLY
jgi:hypothetical protein